MDDHINTLYGLPPTKRPKIDSTSSETSGECMFQVGASLTKRVWAGLGHLYCCALSPPLLEMCLLRVFDGMRHVRRGFRRGLTGACSRRQLIELKRHAGVNDGELVGVIHKLLLLSVNGRKKIWRAAPSTKWNPKKRRVFCATFLYELKVKQIISYSFVLC